MRITLMVRCVGVILLAVCPAAWSQLAQSIPLGQPAAGQIEEPGATRSWTFPGIAGSTVTFTVTGKDGLLPQVALWAPPDFVPFDPLVYGGTVTGQGTAKLSIKNVLLPDTGIYRVALTGAEESTGSFTLKSKVKLPATAKGFGANLPAQTPDGTHTVDFDAPVGALFSVDIKLTDATVSDVSWLTLSGPQGPVDLLPFAVLKKKGATISVKKVPLDSFGSYQLVMGSPVAELDVAVKLKLKLPKVSKKSAPVAPATPAPAVLPLPGPTTSRLVTVRGFAAEPTSTVSVEGPTGMVNGIAPDASGYFEAPYTLAPDMINKLFVRESFEDGTLSPVVPLSVIHDTQPPKVYVDFPEFGQILSTPTATLAGRVSDVLSGFKGLDVRVDGEPAIVEQGVGTNGTWAFDGLPIASDGPTVITVTATDQLGNEASTSHTLYFDDQPATTITIAGGDGQVGTVSELLSKPIKILLTDVFGNPSVERMVTFEVIRSNGTVSLDGKTKQTQKLQVRTDAKGGASVRWRLGGDAGCGNNRMKITAGGTLAPMFVCASAEPNDAKQLNVSSGANQLGQVGAQAVDPLRVWINDGCNGIAGAAVEFVVTEGGGYLVGPNQDAASALTVLTSATGHAQVSWVLGPDPGLNVVEATSKATGEARARFQANGLMAPGTEADTSFLAVVLDNTRRPIVGVKCHLSVGEEDLEKFTDDQGLAIYPSVAASGPAQFHVDGSTATQVGDDLIDPLTSPFVYPALHFETVVVEGAENGLPMPVLLPPLYATEFNSKVFDNTSDVEITLPGIEGLKFTFRANALADHRHPDGTPVDLEHPITVSVHQVQTDDIPMPMPDGAAPSFSFTLQPGGAHFDPPVEVIYPNMAGLPPGAVTNFLSFNHATGRFEIVASGHVIEDGSVSVTDQGSGISDAGWACQCPPYGPTWDCENCVVDVQPPGKCEGPSTGFLVGAVQVGEHDYVIPSSWDKDPTGLPENEGMIELAACSNQEESGSSYEWTQLEGESAFLDGSLTKNSVVVKSKKDTSSPYVGENVFQLRFKHNEEEESCGPVGSDSDAPHHVVEFRVTVMRVDVGVVRQEPLGTNDRIAPSLQGESGVNINELPVPFIVTPPGLGLPVTFSVHPNPNKPKDALSGSAQITGGDTYIADSGDFTLRGGVEMSQADGKSGGQFVSSEVGESFVAGRSSKPFYVCSHIVAHHNTPAGDIFEFNSISKVYGLGLKVYDNFIYDGSGKENPGAGWLATLTQEKEWLNGNFKERIATDPVSLSPWIDPANLDTLAPSLPGSVDLPAGKGKSFNVAMSNQNPLLPGWEPSFDQHGFTLDQTTLASLSTAHGVGNPATWEVFQGSLQTCPRCSATLFPVPNSGWLRRHSFWWSGTQVIHVTTKASQAVSIGGVTFQPGVGILIASAVHPLDP